MLRPRVAGGDLRGSHDVGRATVEVAGREGGPRLGQVHHHARVGEHLLVLEHRADGQARQRALGRSLDVLDDRGRVERRAVLELDARLQVDDPRVKSVFGYQLVASQGLAPLSAPTRASGSSTVDPSRLPVSAHWAWAGFQPLVSARMPTTRLPPCWGFRVVDVSAAEFVLFFELLPHAPATTASTSTIANSEAVGRWDEPVARTRADMEPPSWARRLWITDTDRPRRVDLEGLTSFASRRRRARGSLDRRPRTVVRPSDDRRRARSRPGGPTAAASAVPASDEAMSCKAPAAASA